MFGARALTIGSHVFLGARERASDISLMAHEVAHVVQQQGAPRVQLWSRSSTDPFEREAHRAAAAVVARRPFTVLARTQPRIQRLGISDLLDWFADKANNIPGYRMFTIIIGVNPINGAKVARTGANVLRAAVEFIPGGHLIVEALEKYGVFEKAGAWLERQVATLGMTGRMFIDALKEFIDSLGWRDIFHPGRVWDRAKEIFLRPIRKLIDFFVGLVKGILELIKQAILKPLAKLAEGTPAWDLLLQVLGQNPITGEPVPRSADKLIGGFMKLIKQEELWNNIKRANAIPRAFAWFRGALSGLLAFVTQIPKMFLDALRSLEIADIVLLPRAFVKVGRAFAGIAGRFFSWAVQQVLSLLQIVFEVVAPAAVPYIRKAAGAFNDILRNPVRFLGNLVRAGRQGFDNFRKNFLGHLRKSLIDWLTGTLSGAGVYIPQAFELKEIVKFVLSVLGLTWQNIRGKLLRLIPEPALKAIETGLDIVVTLVREGPAAAWEKIKESLSNLKEMVIEQVMSFVKGTIVEQAITKLLSLLSPVGAFIQAIIGIYNTIMFFIERARQIAQVVASFIDSIAAIASGAVDAAAARVEATLAGFLTTVISFLARFAGLGNVSDMVKKVVDKIRAPIDKALDRVVDWIISIAKRIGRFIMQAGVPQDPNERLRLARGAAVGATRRLSGRVTQSVLQPVLEAIKVRYSLQEIRPVERAGTWWVHLKANPEGEEDTGLPSAAVAAPTAPTWPAGVAANVNLWVPESGRELATVVSLNTDNTISYRVEGGTVRRSRDSFMALWGTRITIGGPETAAQRRAKLVAAHGATIGNAVADAVERRRDLAGKAGIYNPQQAHHVLPVELLSRVNRLRLLVAAGWDFNGKINGIALAAGFHGTHPKYTEYVFKQVEKWESTNGASPIAAFQTWVEGTLIETDLRNKIGAAQASGKSLNDYFRPLV
jgi:hypothetical protein